MLDLDTVTRDIEHWIQTFVEVPHPALGGWPPCPYARSARIKRSYQILVGHDPCFDLKNQASWGMPDQKEVVIYVYDPSSWSAAQFTSSIEQANIEHLLSKDLIALSDHPAEPEVVNGVTMNQGVWALALVQSLNDLDVKSRVIARQGFYHGWPESYLADLFRHRRDPRP